MKNKTSDVRNHLVAAMEALNDESATPEQLAAAVERARAISGLAGQYVSAVRVDIDTARLMHDTGLLPDAVNPPAALGMSDEESGKPRLVYERGRARRS